MLNINLCLYFLFEELLYKPKLRKQQKKIAFINYLTSYFTNQNYKTTGNLPHNAEH